MRLSVTPLALALTLSPSAGLSVCFAQESQEVQEDQADQERRADQEDQADQEGWIVDLTHELSEEIPVFPGGIPFRARPVATFQEDGYFAQALELGEHTGTHWDAPIHFQPGALSAHEIPPDRLLGPGVKISIAEKAADNPDAALTPEEITQWEARNGSIPKGAMVLIDTGWSERWPNEAAYRNTDAQGLMHFPGVSPEAAKILVERGVSMLGIDTLSIDPGLSTQFKAHRILAEGNIGALENLAHLDRLPEAGFTVVVAPLKIRGGSGSPARVLAILDRRQPK